MSNRPPFICIISEENTHIVVDDPRMVFIPLICDGRANRFIKCQSLLEASVRFCELIQDAVLEIHCQRCPSQEVPWYAHQVFVMW